MPASPEQLLNSLTAPHWKAARSTSRSTEGPKTRQPGGGAPMNLTVLDHIDRGRRRLELAALALAAGRDQEADLIRQAVAVRARILTGDTNPVREAYCPYCGTHSLMWAGGPSGRAVCANLLCTPITGTPRRWTVEELLAAKGVARRRFTGANAPAPVDLVDLVRATDFLRTTGEKTSRSTVTTLIKRYGVRTWRVGPHRMHLASLSDVLTAQALYLREKSGACDQTGPDRRPACIGLAGLYTPSTDPARTAARTAAARRVCATCPLRTACSDALTTTNTEGTTK
jgi:hypothetical protein